MKYFVYVLKSKRDGKFYTGMTTNVERRLRQHNRGNMATRSTKNRGPFILVYKEEVETRDAARLREKYLKSGIGREFIKRILRP